MTDTGNLDPPETASHADRLSLVLDDALERRKLIAEALRAAFADYIEPRQTDWIVFKNITADALSSIFLQHPAVLKPITAACNIAGRAIRRDLGFEVNTYKPRLSEKEADQLAGYVRPFLPGALAIPALEAVDDWFFLDKELRKTRGHWERLITQVVSARSGKPFKKRLFEVEAGNGDLMRFELDAAHPPTGEPIQVGIDVKGISHPRDFHKRGDEIVNKAEKFKGVFPDGRFGVVIHYPFLDSRENVVQRLAHPAIDGIVFAGDSKASVELAVLALLPQLDLEVVEVGGVKTVYEQIADD